jgi:hypothetical protein
MLYDVEMARIIRKDVAAMTGRPVAEDADKPSEVIG